jgi:hypothetical protein
MLRNGHRAPSIAELHARPEAAVTEPAPLLLDQAAAAKVMSMSESWLHKATARGEIRCVRLGRCVRYRYSDLVAAVEKGVNRRPKTRREQEN